MAAPLAPIVDHEGPWTEEAYLALPEDPGIELVDGSLLVSPHAGGGHQRLSTNLLYALAAAMPDELEILPTVNLRVGPGRLLVPDLVVITEPGLDVHVYDAAQVAMVVEITGLNHPGIDRAVKPPLYAEAGVPHFLRVELRSGGPVGFAHDLDGDRYRQVARSEPGGPLVLREPFPVELDLTALANATRPRR